MKAISIKKTMLMLFGVAMTTNVFSQTILDGATHVDMYDVPVYVDKAIAKLTQFFEEKLPQSN